jgi:NAD+ diphosphatase
MLGFTAVADPSQPVLVDREEIVDARWFSRREIAAMVAKDLVDPATGERLGLPVRASIAYFLIDRWLSG